MQTSLLEAMVSLTDYQAARWLIDKEVPEQAGNDHPTAIPTGVFPTADGHINIATAGEEMWRRLCVALDAPGMHTRPEYANNDQRSRNRDTLKEDISRITMKKTSAEWMRIFERESVASGPIYRMNEVFEDPQTRHLGIATNLTHPRLGQMQMVGQPFRLTRTPSSMRNATPDRGEHTDEILAHLGYTQAQIDDYRARKVV